MAMDAVKNMLHRMWSRMPDRTKFDMPNYYHTSPRLDPVRYIAHKAANVDLYVYDSSELRKDREKAVPLEDHELYDLFEHPCPTFSELDGWTLRYLTFANYIACGEFFWLKVRQAGAGSRIIALLPIPPSWIPKRPTVGDHQYLVYPYGVTASSVLAVDASDMVWFKDPDIADPYGNGRASAESIGDEIQSDEYAAKYQKNFFFNDATSPYVIFDPNGTQQSATQLKQNFIQKLTGWAHAREPAVLTGRDVSIQQLGMAPKELDMTESRKFLRDECLQHYNIPPECFGIIENSNRSTIDSAFYLFNKNVLVDYLRMYERAVSNQLCWSDYGGKVCVRFDQIVDEDEDFKLRKYDDGLDRGAVTVGEWREAMRLPVKPSDDVYLRPFSAVEVRQGDSAPQKPATDEGADGGKTVRIRFEKSDGQARKMRCWKMFDVRARQYEKPYAEAMKKIFTRQFGDVKRAVGHALTNGDSVDGAVASCYTAETDKAFKRGMASAWMQGLGGGADHAHDVLGDGKAYKDGTLDSYFNLWVEKHGLEQAKIINDTTHKELLRKLQEELAAAQEDGDGLRETEERMSRTIDEYGSDIEQSRIPLIARTETVMTVNFGSLAGYKTEGVMQKQWLATLDDRTRESHADADMQVVGIDEAFTVNGSRMDYPGDPSAPADEVCNCRCTMMPVVG